MQQNGLKAEAVQEEEMDGKMIDWKEARDEVRKIDPIAEFRHVGGTMTDRGWAVIGKRYRSKLHGEDEAHAAWLEAYALHVEDISAASPAPTVETEGEREKCRWCGEEIVAVDGGGGTAERWTHKENSQQTLYCYCGGEVNDWRLIEPESVEGKQEMPEPCKHPFRSKVSVNICGVCGTFLGNIGNVASKLTTVKDWLEDALGRFQVTHVHSSVRGALKLLNAQPESAEFGEQVTEEDQKQAKENIAKEYGMDWQELVDSLVDHNRATDVLMDLASTEECLLAAKREIETLRRSLTDCRKHWDEMAGQYNKAEAELASLRAAQPVDAPNGQGWCSSCDKMHDCARPLCPKCNDYLIFPSDDTAGPVDAGEGFEAWWPENGDDVNDMLDSEDRARHIWAAALASRTPEAGGEKP